MSSTRDVIAPPIFAEDASTTIPPTPIAGQSYRDPTAGPASSSEGWPYAQIVNSAEWNQLVYQWSSLLSILDKKGILGWSSDVNYTEPSLVFGSDGAVYKWLQASGPSGVGARDPISQPTFWAPFGISTDFLNTTRIDVASAATINLTSAAPNTRHINITGTTTITGFTIAVGQCYFVRFDGALTLTNSASLVTQRGANILTAAGDTCIIRATAANTVEILCYVSRGIRLGTAQTPLSGTSVDFLGIPPNANRVTIMLSGASTNGASSIQVQLGSSGGIETTGYNGAAEINAAATANSSGLQVNRGADAASLTTGSATLTRIDGNQWVISGTFWLDNVNKVGYIAGRKIITGGALDRIRVTTVNGTDVFDAGMANIAWEIGG